MRNVPIAPQVLIQSLRPIVASHIPDEIELFDAYSADDLADIEQERMPTYRPDQLTAESGDTTKMFLEYFALLKAAYSTIMYFISETFYKRPEDTSKKFSDGQLLEIVFKQLRKHGISESRAKVILYDTTKAIDAYLRATESKRI